MQPCKTGDQPYSDPSPNGECSLADTPFDWFPKNYELDKF